MGFLRKPRVCFHLAAGKVQRCGEKDYKVVVVVVVILVGS